MNRKVAMAVYALILTTALTFGGRAGAQATGDVPTFSFQPQGAASAATAREDELYNDGTEALNDGKWQEAMQKFTSVAEMKGRRADAALYWKAYAQSKLGHRAEALATVAELRRQHPQSKWLKDAGALELEIKQAQGVPVRPESEENCELKVMALNSLMNSDEQRAIPMVEAVLRSNNCPKVKEKALFVLAQSDSPKAQQVIASVARGQLYPEMQRKAIQYLATNGTAQNKKSLVEIYNGSNDPLIRRAVLQSFIVCDCKEELLAAMRAERDPSLRHEAIRNLGVMGAHDELHQMYQAAPTVEDKRAIIEALSVSDDVPFLAQIAKSDSDISIRKAAIRGLGISGGKARQLLLEIYNADQNVEVRRAAIEGLFINDACPELVALARKETDPQMKRALIEKLSLVDCREARDYMIEILNK